MAKPNDFDIISGWYDPLSFLVFGKSIKRSQTYFLSTIGSEVKDVLLMGGGTGWLLNSLDELHRPIRVTYIEASAKMLDKAQRKAPFENIEVDYVLGTEKDISTERIYDVVITHFFLDVFAPQHLKLVMDQMCAVLKPGGAWFCTDFVLNDIWWQKVLVACMHCFFKITARLEAKRLQNFDQLFLQRGFNPVAEKCFYFGMIKSRVLKRI